MSNRIYRLSTTVALALGLAVLGPAMTAHAQDMNDDRPAASANASGGGRGNIGVGTNLTLNPGFNGLSTGAAAISLRIWLDRLMLEPLFALAVLTGANGASTQFGLGAGMLVGYALSTGNLRPIVGGGLTFAVASSNNTTGNLTFGPMFGIEYRFTELPALGLDAAIFAPFSLNFSPFTFGLSTQGAALLGFHYYF